MSRTESTEPSPEATADAGPSLPEAPEQSVPDEGTAAWRATMVDIMREVLLKLPDETSLGELVEAAESNPAMASGLKALSIQDLIEIAVSKPISVDLSEEDEDDEDDESGPTVIRRRADIPNGDVTLLSLLADKGPQSEPQLRRALKVNPDQLRLLLRGLQTKGYIHVEGSGKKRKIKITRNGGGFLRKKTGRASSGRGRRRRR